jgi:hypothetical protein
MRCSVLYGHPPQPLQPLQAMSNMFSSPRLRIETAREHTDDLRVRCDAYLSSRPFEDRVERRCGFDWYKVRLTRKAPDRLGVLCAKIGEDLRSALDHTAHAAGVLSRAPRLDKIHFPFGKTADDVEKSIKDNCKGIRPEFVTLFRAFKTYKEGDTALYALNELRKAANTESLRP